MARCRRGLRPANSVSAAPSIGISTGSGVSTDAELIASPPVPGQRIEFVRRVGVASPGRVAGRSSVDVRAAIRSGELAQTRVSSGSSLDFLGGGQPIRAVGQRQHERGDAHA